FHVTGVQTCALPISEGRLPLAHVPEGSGPGTATGATPHHRPRITRPPAPGRGGRAALRDRRRPGPCAAAPRPGRGRGARRTARRRTTVAARTPVGGRVGAAA